MYGIVYFSGEIWLAKSLEFKLPETAVFFFETNSILSFIQVMVRTSLSSGITAREKSHVCITSDVFLVSSLFQEPSGKLPLTVCHPRGPQWSSSLSSRSLSRLLRDPAALILYFSGCHETRGWRLSSQAYEPGTNWFSFENELSWGFTGARNKWDKGSSLEGGRPMVLHSEHFYYYFCPGFSGHFGEFTEETHCSLCPGVPAPRFYRVRNGVWLLKAPVASSSVWQKSTLHLFCLPVGPASHRQFKASETIA